MMTYVYRVCRDNIYMMMMMMMMMVVVVVVMMLMMMMMMHVSIIYIYMYIRTDYPYHVSFLSRVETIWYICMCSFIWLLSRFKKNCSKSPRSKTPIWAYKRCNSHWLVPIYHWVICTILKHNSHNFSIVLPKLNH